MKTLGLLRHAKSDWAMRARDFDRPLNERGRKARR
jgi:phosphohistidine phosphatase